MEHVTSQGHALYCEIIGEGVPLLILHGWSLDMEVMKSCLEPTLSAKGDIKRIYVDLPGTGRSAADPAIRTTEGMVQRLLALADDVIGDRPFLLCGDSYGAYLARAILHARLQQVAGMFLFCPIVFPDKSRRTLPAPLTIRANAGVLAEIPAHEAARFQSMATVQDRPQWERFRQEVLPALARADQAYLDVIRNEGYGCPYDVDALPCAFAGPVTIVAGRQDASVGFHDALVLSERYPRATCAVLDRAAHILQIEQPDIFSTLLSEWVDRVFEELQAGDLA